MQIGFHPDLTLNIAYAYIPEHLEIEVTLHLLNTILNLSILMSKLVYIQE